MNLCSLSERRKRGDLIITYQALRSAHSPIKHLFPLETSKRTRGHAFKLLKDKFRTSVRQKCITNRVFDDWNGLPEEIVLARSIIVFKSSYDAYKLGNSN
jgi:hypothetical protein